MALTTNVRPPVTNRQRAAGRSVPPGPPGRRYLGTRLGRHAILILIALLFLVPFGVMVTSAFKTPNEMFASGFLPTKWVISNFVTAVDSMPFVRYLGNTLFLVVFNVAATLLSCPFVGYGLAKFYWRGQGLVFGSVLATMMLPAQVTLVPLYLLWDKVSLVGSFWPLIIPQFFGTSIYIFLFRQFFATVPNALREAAIMDGASEVRAYFKVILPQAKAALATVAVFQFVATWTDFLLPLVYLNKSQDYTLSLGLYNFVNQHGVEWGPLMACCVLFTLPMVVLFMVAQRYFVTGIATTGIR